jgi:hypothetical protein
MDPYYSPPEDEEPRTQRVRDGVREYVKNLKGVLFMVLKSWNDNVLLYEYEDSDSVVTAQWLSLEPSDKERHLKLKNYSLRSNLNPAEELLFGCSVNVVEGNRFILRINAEQLKSRVFEIVMDSSGNPAVIGSVNGIMCRVEYAYVHMRKGLVPDADYMNFYGRSLKDGAVVMEKILN